MSVQIKKLKLLQKPIKIWWNKYSRKTQPCKNCILISISKSPASYFSDFRWQKKGLVVYNLLVMNWTFGVFGKVENAYNRKRQCHNYPSLLNIQLFLILKSLLKPTKTNNNPSYIFLIFTYHKRYTIYVLLL